jgi:Flp pilus assembly protein TadG
MIRLAHMVRDSRGAAIIEFALVLPVLVLFVYGTFVVGQLFEANAGMQNALGEGARYATIYPTPGVDQIRAKIAANTFGTSAGTFTVAPPVPGTGYMDLSVTFSTPTNFIFFSGPTVSITKTKRVYTAV